MRIYFKTICALLLAVSAPAVPASNEGSPSQTLTGFALDAAWKQKIYRFARQKLLHPAWGWSHSERNYALAMELAAKEGLTVDPDILFAAAFTHDVGAIGKYQKDGVDHAVRSVELATPLLLEAGFPERKLTMVHEVILGHMHDKEPGRSNEAVLLHDADTLDFLGTIGVARRLSVTGDATDYVGGLARIREFSERLPTRLITASAKRMAPSRVAEMRQFLDQLSAETSNDRLP